MKAALEGLIGELNQSQWFTLEQIRNHQERSLSSIVIHHAVNTPWFQNRLKSFGLEARDIVTLEGLKQLEPFKKRDIQLARDNFYSVNIPKQHHPLGEAKTSGSTGEPVTIKKTVINQLFWMANAIRDHEWHKRDYRGRFAAIRAGFLEIHRFPDWTGPVPMLYGSGPSLGIPVTTVIDEQLALLEEFQPNIITVHAGVLSGFVSVWEKTGFTLTSLKHIKNIGDTVSPLLRQRVKVVTGLDIEDNYSSSENGTISIQCPHSGQQHIMSESLIVEILNQDGTETPPGEIGRVVITDLFNTASPMIRYDIGDYARVGTPCTCGRHMPTLSEIVGRERNLIIRSDGSRHWPRAGFMELEKIVPVRQWQIIQHTLTDIEYKLVTDDPITPEQEAQFKELFLKVLDYPWNIAITWVKDSIPPGKNGKFEESICLVPQ
jgi:phenylacetate-CoA ligase